MGFTVWILIAFIMEGLDIAYGNGKKRRVQVWDPEKRKYKPLEDDGTYVIHNGKIVGR